MNKSTCFYIYFNCCHSSSSLTYKMKNNIIHYYLFWFFFRFFIKGKFSQKRATQKQTYLFILVLFSFFFIKDNFPKKEPLKNIYSGTFFVFLLREIFPKKSHSKINSFWHFFRLSIKGNFPKKEPSKITLERILKNPLNNLSPKFFNEFTSKLLTLKTYQILIPYASCVSLFFYVRLVVGIDIYPHNHSIFFFLIYLRY